MILKLESLIRREDEGGNIGSTWTEVDYIDGYKRITAKCNVGGDPEPDIVLGTYSPSPAYLERQKWGPMQILGWLDDTADGKVDIIHVYLYEGDRLWLMNDEGKTLDRLFPA